MFKLIQKLFIKDYQKVEDVEVRERYGSVISLVSIFFNVILVSFKLFVSFVTNSISIRADALNNLSDVGSNVATLFGFKLASKHADADHPYGHGRMENVSGLIIAFLILLVGASALIDSVKKIFSPEKMDFSYVSLIILIVSILIKLEMFLINKRGGSLIKSETLLAAGQDSLNDSLTTFVTLIALLVNYFFNFNIDAYAGALVSCFVLKSGVEIFKNVMDTILGMAPDKEFVKEIEKFVMSHEGVLGIHDLMYHDYGPSSRFITLHVEVDSRADLIEIHDVIDNIEKEILERFNVLATIHLDPLVLNDPVLDSYKAMIREIIGEMNPVYRFHDFRMVKGPTHTNLVFDLVIPAENNIDHEIVRRELCQRVSEIDNSVNLVVEIEHSFVD